jgi:hypothetical protein
MARIQDKRRPILRVALVLLIVAAVGLHVAGALALTTTSTRGLASVPAPIPYILMGVVLAVLVFKIAHISRLVHGRKKASAPETLYDPDEKRD